MEKNKPDKKQEPPKLDQWRVIWGPPQPKKKERTEIVIKWPDNQPGGKHGK